MSPLHLITLTVMRPGVLSMIQRDDMMNALGHAQQFGWIRLYAFVVMPDHWQALVRPGDRHPLPTAIHLLIRRAVFPSRQRGEKLLWEGDPRRRILPSPEMLHEVRSYVEKAPQRKGWVRRASEWPWSSAHPEGACLLHQELAVSISSH